MSIDGSGNLLIAGYAYNSVSYEPEFAVARYTSAGSLDTGFASGGVASVDFGVSYGIANAVALDAQGRILLAGYVAGATSGVQDIGLMRLSAAGVGDATFGASGVTTTSFSGNDMGYGSAVDPRNGDIVVLALDRRGHGFRAILARRQPGHDLRQRQRTGRF